MINLLTGYKLLKNIKKKALWGLKLLNLKQEQWHVRAEEFFIMHLLTIFVIFIAAKNKINCI